MGMNGIMIRVFLGLFLCNIVVVLIYFIKGTIGRYTRTCLKLCQSTSNDLSTPRYTRYLNPNTGTNIFSCFSHLGDLNMQIGFLQSDVFCFIIGVYHRPSLLRTKL